MGNYYIRLYRKMSGCCVWDFTSYETDVDLVKKWCMEHCKKWAFQQEECPSTERLHFQGRVSLQRKARATEIPKDNLKFHWTPTSKENRTNNFYVTKEDTRVAGPWKDDDEKKVMTTQLDIFLGFALRGYQAWIKEQCDVFSMRTIDLLYDPTGNIGKSLFSEYMEYIGLVEEIPPYRLMDDIFQWVYGRPKKKAYFLDLPRGMKKDKLADLYSGIEVIKNGIAYDKRHFPKKERFTRPRVFVFTNELPCLSLMSRDRWVIHTVDKDYNIIPYDPDAEESGSDSE